MFLLTAKIHLSPALTRDFWAKAHEITKSLPKDRIETHKLPLGEEKGTVHLSSLDRILKARVQRGSAEQYSIRLFTSKQCGEISWAAPDGKVYSGVFDSEGDIFPIRFLGSPVESLIPDSPDKHPSYSIANELLSNFNEALSAL